MSEKIIFRLSNDVNFRICQFDDCTNRDGHWREHMVQCNGRDKFNCFHEGDVHLHCFQHKEIELTLKGGGLRGPKDNAYICSICLQNPESIAPTSLTNLLSSDIAAMKDSAKSIVNSSKFKKAKFYRLDDYYIPELTESGLATKKSKYWMSYDVKKNKDGRAILILYLGDRSDKSKVQFFIEPESEKLSHDHNDTSPISIISRIEIQFKDGCIELKSRENNDNTI